jgi:hypothetical protein
VLDPEQLTDEARERWLQRCAEAVVRRRMETPAVLALELHRPLAFLGSQAVIVATPFLAPLVGLDTVRELTLLLQEPGSVDLLIRRIETLSAEGAADAA